MVDTLSIIDNALSQGFTYCIAVIGVLIAFRVCRYPDLTPDGSFLLGCASFAALVRSGVRWEAAMLAAGAVGAVAGVLTAGLNITLNMSRLLTGILTTMICYSVAFRILQGQPNVGVADADTLFSHARAADERSALAAFSVHPWELLATAACVAVFAGAAFLVLRSETGLFIRANGENSARIEDTGRRSWIYMMLGLALANSLVAVSGAVLTARQGFADIGTSFGVIITLVAALVMGEEMVRRLGRRWRSLLSQFSAAFIGSAFYFLLYLAVLRLSIRGILPFSIRPTDLKLISALFVVAVIALNRRRLAQGEDVLPL